MLGLMQDWPLVVSKIIDHAAIWHGDVEIVTHTVEGPVHRYNWAECNVRAKKVAQALERYGVKRGDRIATLAWNTYRHVELWYGISGMGAVAHTVNPRLFAEQIIYIANHAEDRVMFLDKTFVPMIEPLQAELKSIEAYVVMTDKANMPETSLKNVICYEDFIAAEDGNYPWPDLDENTAAGLCYTSGTTGNPKGVLYSHRSNVLHTFGSIAKDAIGISSTDTVLPIVPM
ncbi:MAG: AMP-binding protein, partial [Sphingomonadales bacterium]|nr:AMP-binding protein [Sphingomonadales bacterium]